MTFAKFLITFFIEQLQWLLLRFYRRFERNLEQKQVQLSTINTWFSWKKWFAATKISISITNLLKERNSWEMCFDILNFTKRFCWVTYFVKVFMLLLFFFLSNSFMMCFIHQGEILSLLHRWDYCWKCEFDVDIKIEYRSISPWWRAIRFL